MPLFGYQFIIVSIFGNSWPLASLGLIVLGGFMVTRNSTQKKRAINNLIALQPKSSAEWIDKGNVLNKIGEKDETIKAYEQAIKLKPDCAEAWYNKSTALASIGRLDDSIEARQRAMELNPELKNVVDCKNF
ncbi:tetratricopeptide repeat protein [Methanosarcina sp. T3]|uniref:tetratricopeptide repeat protein n=1 Tax=Methanosarcina sp. T3 TaxID=3439062 RepID=UPI003F84B575